MTPAERRAAARQLVAAQVKPVQPHAKAALTHARLAGVMEELHARYGLVPAAALAALGVIEPTRHRADLTATLRVNLRAAAQAPTRRPHVHACYHGPPVTPLKAVNPARLDRTLQATLQRLGLVPDDLDGHRIYRPPGMTEGAARVKWNELTRPGGHGRRAP